MSNLILVGSIFAFFSLASWNLSACWSPLLSKLWYAAWGLKLQIYGTSTTTVTTTPSETLPSNATHLLAETSFSIKGGRNELGEGHVLHQVGPAGEWPSDHHQVPLSEPPPPQLHQVQSYMPETPCQLRSAGISWTIWEIHANSK